jgi:hypothetical protein
VTIIDSTKNSTKNGRKIDNENETDSTISTALSVRSMGQYPTNLSEAQYSEELENKYK